MCRGFNAAFFAVSLMPALLPATAATCPGAPPSDVTTANSKRLAELAQSGHNEIENPSGLQYDEVFFKKLGEQLVAIGPDADEVIFSLLTEEGPSAEYQRSDLIEGVMEHWKPHKLGDAARLAAVSAYPGIVKAAMKYDPVVTRFLETLEPSPELIAALTPMITAEYDPAREAACKIVVAAGSAQVAAQNVEERLIPGLRSRKIYFRFAVAQGLVALGPPGIAVILHVSKMSEDEPRKLALAALGTIPEEQVTPQVLAALERGLLESDFNCGMAASQSLGKLGASGQRILLKHLFDARRVDTTAMIGFDKVPYCFGVMRAIGAASNRRDPAVQSAVRRILAITIEHPKDIGAELLGLLDDPDRHVRLTAAYTTGEPKLQNLMGPYTQQRVAAILGQEGVGAQAFDPMATPAAWAIPAASNPAIALSRKRERSASVIRVFAASAWGILLFILVVGIAAKKPGTFSPEP